MAEQLAPCPCGAAVVIRPSYGGAGGNAPFYKVICPKCKASWDDMGNGDGTRRSAVREWNRMRKEKWIEG